MGSIGLGCKPSSWTKCERCSTQARPDVLRPLMAFSAIKQIGLPSIRVMEEGGNFSKTFIGFPSFIPRGDAINAALTSIPITYKSSAPAVASMILSDSMELVGELTIKSLADAWPLATSRATSLIRTFVSSFWTHTQRQLIIGIPHFLARTLASDSGIGFPTCCEVIEVTSVNIPLKASSLSRYWPVASEITYPGKTT